MSNPGPAAPPPAPGFEGHPLLGDLPRVLKGGLLPTLEEGWRRFGDVVRFCFLDREVHLLVHPEHARRVLVARRDLYVKGDFYRRIRRVTGEGLVVSEGELWRTRRRQVQPLFTADALARFAPWIQAAAGRLAADWAVAAEEERVVDLGAQLQRVALEVIAGVTVSATLADDGALGRAVTRLVEASDVASACVLPSWEDEDEGQEPAPPPEIAAALALLDGRIREAVEARGPAPLGRPDLLDQLLALRAAGEPLSRRELEVELRTFFLAGAETTGHAMAWTWVMLDRHPEAAARLRTELDGVLEGRPLAAADLERLPWLDQVVRESLRLRPPAWVLPRDALGDDVIDGYPLPAGGRVLLSPYLTHRHPDFWPEPERFLPERFAAPPRSRYAFLPFGAGPRACIGAALSLLEMRLTLATLAARFEVRIEGPAEPSFATVLSPAGPLRARILRRERP
jgi:cytochrome P450